MTEMTMRNLVAPDNKARGLRRVLLGTSSAIGVAFGLGLGSAQALAACTPTSSPPDNSSVTCSGTTTTIITSSGSGDNITVTLLDGASINVTNNSAISLGHNGVIVLGKNATISTTGNLYAGIVASYGSHVTLGAGSSISTTGNGGAGGIRLFGNNVVLTLSDASIHTSGSTAFSIASSGMGLDLNHPNEITLNGASSLVSSGFGSGGIFVGAYTIVTMNDSSAIRTTGDSARGITTVAGFNTVTLNGNATIETTGAGSDGVFLGGLNNTLRVSAGARISASGNNASAVTLLESNDSLVNHGTLRSSSAARATVTGGNGTQSVYNDGVIIGAGGKAIDLGIGDDQLILATGSLIEGSIDGGSGTDVVTLQGQDHADNNFLGFETLIMNGQDWSLSGTNTFSNGVDIQRGRLAVNGAITSPLFTVQDAGILGGNGSLTGNVTSTGTIAPGNSVGTLTINGNFTQTGGGFDTQFDQHGIDKLNVIGGTATLSGAPRLRVSPIGGAAGANGVILHADNGITGSFGSVAFQGNGAATLIQTANDISLTTIDGTAIEGTAFAASQAGLDYLDAVDAELAAGLDGCGDDSCARDAAKKHLWAKAFGRFGSEAAQDGNRPFDYRIAGSAIGADMPVAPGLRLGGSFGYSNTDETLTHDAASADINTTQAALYAKYQTGRFFVTGELAGGWQHLDLSRNLGGSQSADANTNGWLFGSSLQAGATFAFPHGWRLTPSLGAAYQHQWVDGYGEHNGGAGNTSIASHQSDALRLRAQLLLRQDYQLSDMTLTPHIKVGAMRELNLGGHADGSFAVDGSDFTVSLNDTSRTIGLVGLGLQVGFANGLTTYVDYDAALSRQGDVHSITGGLRYDW